MKKTKQDLIIKAQSIHDLTNPPVQDFLSSYEYIQAGEAALIHIIKYINLAKYSTGIAFK